MCSLCLQTPCPSRCPNHEEIRDSSRSCAICGGSIIDGDAYYKLFDELICEECVINERRICYDA
jgi:hypothetical protein